MKYAIVIVLATVSAFAQALPSDFFENKVRPVLAENCYDCHTSAEMGGLRVDSRERLLQGGKSGPAVMPGDPDKSLLIQAVRQSGDLKMPKGGKLKPAEIQALTDWVKSGAPWPETKTAAVSTSPVKVITPEQRAFWSFQPLKDPAIPAVKEKSWAKTDIDHFVLARLEAKGIKPVAPADKRALIRRVTLDLTGLPPTPEEVEAFVNDKSANAYEKVVDRLLASPRYGERWARFWLDVVHYGDTHGYDKDKRRDHAWPYRDYVIRSFNDDKPYPRFIKEQLAGDVFYPDDPDGLIATGFVVAGPWDFVGEVELREGTVDKEKTRLLDRDDMVASTFSTFMSLTVGCARCHDHKFDPISQKDYYRLQAVFAGVERGDRTYYALDKLAEKANLDESRKLLVNHRQALQKRMQEVKTPDEALRDAIVEDNSAIALVDKKLKALASVVVYAVKPLPPRPIHILKRGDVEQPGETVTPGGLACTTDLDPNFRESETEGGRRAALAAWISHPDNPLTWRSIVNRIWQTHFGRGLVDTPNDFGRNGSLPTHPELLDWLAAEFRDQGGSLKKLHREILLSATYQQSSVSNAAFAKIDAGNRYLWRQNRVRLDAESVRDTLLAVSGKLDFKVGGPGFELFQFKDDHSPIYDHTVLEKIYDPATYRRTVYRFTVRSVPNPFLDSLDCSDPNLNTPVRNTTLTALQALTLLNDPFLIKQAEFFAERLRKISDDSGNQIDAAYRLLFGHLPDAEERAALVDFVHKHGLAQTCRLLLNTNEFVFID
jgi:uncharacterized protein DUF1553/uncharacterized protein DUF1549/cytochrome c